MKHVFIYVFMAVLVVFMVILINKNHDEVDPVLLSIDTYYSYVDQDGEVGYIDFYINTNHHPLIDTNSYANFKLHNIDDSKSIDLEIKDIIYHHQEMYLNETYLKYSYVFDMPLLGYDFDIKSCYMNVVLINEDVYDIYIGAISFKTIDNIENNIDWTALSGTKAEGQYLSRLNQIQVEYDILDQEIESISLGNLYDVSFTIEDQILAIDIAYESQLFYACPIYITYIDHRNDLINYFVYIKDFETLKQSGQLIYHYALN